MPHLSENAQLGSRDYRKGTVAEWLYKQAGPGCKRRLLPGKQGFRAGSAASTWRRCARAPIFRSMPLYRDRPPLPEEPIWRWILAVLLASTVLATLLALAADSLWGQPLLAEVAGWSAIVTAALYLFFRWLGAREAAKRAGGAGDHSGDESGGGA